jgi:outer membrane lipoprotein LolB
VKWRAIRGHPFFACAVWGLMTLGLIGCAQPPKIHSPGTPPSWSGRIAIAIDSAPVQRWNANFELEGGPSEGALRLFSPLGQTLASAQWQQTGAQLHQNNTVRAYNHMAELTETLIGTALPLEPFFDWLQGKPTPSQGWTVDTSGHAQGRIQAERLTPLPTVQLRLVLDPP